MEYAVHYLSDEAAAKCSLDQITLNPDCSYDRLQLNDVGRELVDNILAKVQKNDFTDTLKNCKIIRARSGSGLSHGVMCAWDNCVAEGLSTKRGKEVTTSIIRLIGDGWILTCSESLYKLE